MGYWSIQYFKCLIHKLKSTWLTNSPMPLLSFLDNLLEDACINVWKMFWQFWERIQNMLISFSVNASYVFVVCLFVCLFNWSLLAETHSGRVLMGPDSNKVLKPGEKAIMSMLANWSVVVLVDLSSYQLGQKWIPVWW